MKFTSQMANRNFEYVKCKRQKGMDLKKKTKPLASQCNSVVKINHIMDINMSGYDREMQDNTLMR